MNEVTEQSTASSVVVDRPTGVLELADGTRLVPDDDRGNGPSRLDGKRSEAFSLADAMREGGEPFAGYRVRRAD